MSNIVDWDWVKGAGSLLGGIGNIYSTVQQDNQYKRLNDLYEDERQRNIDKEEKAQEAFNSGFTNQKKKDDESIYLGV